MLRSWELVLPLKWPSQNELGANSRGFAGRKYRAFKAKFHGYMHNFKRVVPTATGWRRAHILRLYGKRCRPFDYANLVGGGKPMIDSMVDLGYLLDDSPKLFLGSYHQAANPTGAHEIFIRLEECATNETKGAAQ